MALTFGKGNRSIAFNPTSAFPLDARSYFESYYAAELAARSAEEAGSTNSQYYFGQQIVVVEDNIASFYIIQTDGTLSEVGGKVEIDTDVFEYQDNKLNLLGFAEAAAGAQLVKDSDGKLSWVKPDTTTVEGLSTAIEALEKDLDENYYTKQEANELIASIPHMKRKIVSSIKDIDVEAIDADSYIYMVPTGLENESNKYYEYMIVVTEIEDSDGIVTVIRDLQKIGTWEVELDDYATHEDVEQALSTKVNKVDGYVLISEEELNRLASIPTGAEPNFISNVNSNELVVTSGKLEIVLVDQSKIKGLTERLQAIEGSLSSNDFTDELKQKLEQINLNDINNMYTEVGDLSKTVYGYYDEIEQKNIPGLASLVSTVSSEVITLKEKTMQVADKTTSLEHSIFGYIDNEGTEHVGLSTEVKTLQQTVADFDKTYVSLANFNTVVGNMDTLLASNINIKNEIDDINERLTWGEISL